MFCPTQVRYYCTLANMARRWRNWEENKRMQQARLPRTFKTIAEGQSLEGSHKKEEG
jgi:hypothetical protein